MVESGTWLSRMILIGFGRGSDFPVGWRGGNMKSRRSGDVISFKELRDEESDWR
jgi:hypothetical protein